ncbi:MAG: AAA family ATPase [Candidatus Thorarchaeota archaeon]
MTKRKDSAIDTPSASRETTKPSARKRVTDVPTARLVILKDVGYPFRLKGDPKPSGLTVDNEDLFADYAREQWMGSIVKSGMYLFDRYIIPDYAFQVDKVEPENSIISKNTRITLRPTIESTTMPVSKPVSLDNVVGHEKVKKKCRLILKYLENPQSFGEWAPRAVLFHGPPGTGKTLTARAVASQANAQIFLAKASDLIGVHVGDGGRRISTLFDNARKNSPSIVFIDELDAIGLARSFQSIRGDVSEVVTALLGEFDQTGEQSGVVIIGATNALSLIDPALRNRFDTVFAFTLPNVKERLEILEMYSKKLPITMNADLRHIAEVSEGLSGRDLRDRVLKESLHHAISEGSATITDEIVNQVLGTLKTQHRPIYTI